jgi:hypothetical protein
MGESTQHRLAAGPNVSNNPLASRALCCAFVLLLSACVDDGLNVDSGSSSDSNSAPVEVSLGGDTAPSEPTPPSGECLDDSDCATSGAPPCQRAVCREQACIFVVADDQAPCEDGNPCTVDTFCASGSCGGGRATACNDGNPCTVDTCDPLTGCSYAASAPGGVCDDNDPCSLNDTCLEGTCIGTADPECACEVDDDCVKHEDDSLCNGSLRCLDSTCRLDPSTAVTCPPSDGCAVTACQPSTGACVTQAAPNGTGCDDGNPCTVDDRCAESICEGSPGACPCSADDDCAVLQTESYDLCQGPLRCAASGLCAPDASQAVTCPTDDDPTDCINVQCNPGTAVCATVHLQDGSDCEGGDPCSPVGACKAGQCIVPTASCDDGDPCTDDSCAGEAGCLHNALSGGACSDNDACTHGDQCYDGQCLGGSAVVCDDNNPCTLDKCVSGLGGCTVEPLEDGLDCQPLDLCMRVGQCLQGSCTGGVPTTCAAASPCTTIQCLADTGCIEEPVEDGAACEDGDACTQTGVCQDGTCGTVPMACNDDNPCTMDSCSAGACEYTDLVDGSDCDTGNACEEDASCTSGLCQGAIPTTCEPGPCHVKGCDPSTGACVVTHVSENGANCGATNGCQLPGLCTNGECLGVTEVSCDDGDACTADLCQPEFGLCKHSPAMCPPDPAAPCSIAACDPDLGCTLVEDLTCNTETLIWFNDFECSESDLWSWGEELGHPLFQLTQSSPATGALTAGCQATIDVASEAVATDTPWTSSMVSQEFALPTGYEGPLTIRFWQAWEWEGVGMNEDIERRLQLLDAEMLVIESQPLSDEAVAWGTWMYEEVIFNVTSSGAHRLALTLTSKPTDAALGCRWRLDHVVVFTSAALTP